MASPLEIFMANHVPQGFEARKRSTPHPADTLMDGGPPFGSQAWMEQVRNPVLGKPMEFPTTGIDWSNVGNVLQRIGAHPIVRAIGSPNLAIRGALPEQQNAQPFVAQPADQRTATEIAEDLGGTPPIIDDSKQGGSIFKPGPGISGGSTASATTFGRTPDWLAASNDPQVTEAPVTQPSTPSRLDDIMSQLTKVSQPQPRELVEDSWGTFFTDIARALASSSDPSQQLAALGATPTVAERNQEIQRLNQAEAREAQLANLTTQLEAELRREEERGKNTREAARLRAEVERAKAAKAEAEVERKRLQQNADRSYNIQRERLDYEKGGADRAAEREQRLAINEVFADPTVKTKMTDLRTRFREIEPSFFSLDKAASVRNQKQSIVQEALDYFNDQGLPLSEMKKRLPKIWGFEVKQ